MILVFTGIQGCGKGTQARKLVDNYGFKLFEMGTELRRITESGSELGNHIKHVINSGKLVDGETVGNVMKTVIDSRLEAYNKQILDCILSNPSNHSLCYVGKNESNIILDGFVRNIENKASLEKIMNDYKVVFFNLSKEKAEARLLGRMYNPVTGETFQSETAIDPNEKLDWKDRQLVKRKDDNEESIRKRIEEFTTKTLPVVEEQRKEGRVIEINADQSVDQVHEEIIEKLGISKN